MIIIHVIINILILKINIYKEFFVYKALDELIPMTENDFISFKDTVIDKYNRQGYLIYVGIYYIFQPFDQNENVPMYYRTTFNKSLKQQLSLTNYLKNIIKHKGFESMAKEYDTNISESSINEIDAFSYDFDNTMEYYDSRDEFDYVGIIDKELSRRKSKTADELKDVFKIREKREKILEKKRGTGIPSLKGAVCYSSKGKKYLENISNKFDIKLKGNETRISICNKIKEKMLLLEKYSNDKITYIMIPYNHPTIPFPLNLLDRIDQTKEKIKENIRFKINMSVKKTKKKSGPEKGYPSYKLIIKNEAKLSKFSDFFTSLGAEKIKSEWIINFE